MPIQLGVEDSTTRSATKTLCSSTCKLLTIRIITVERGYGVFEVNGTSISWFYKSIGKERKYQFRSSVTDRFGNVYEEEIHL